ncbi:hypothetical protein HYU50_01790 [Candidatus Woesearchaeota archaeon]|nr:hypothetical protein [Candidatus Woesearchaeota archaeon]
MAKNKDIKELKKELRKLKPADSIKKLKEMEEKRKEEITEIEDLIKDFEKEMKTDLVAEEIAPEARDVNIANLFEEESRELEFTVKKEAPGEDKSPGYVSIKQLYGDYTALKDIQYASITGSLTPAHLDKVDQIGERLDRTKYHSASQDAANILVASRATLYKIRKYAGLE